MQAFRSLAAECQSLSLLTDGSCEKSCVSCVQVDDLLSLVAELRGIRKVKAGSLRKR